MKKTIRMVLYGEPGVGKSTFAFGAPKPFFITTDTNYEYLEDYFGANDADHRQVFTWAEAKKTIESLDSSNYETIVVDLLEDLYMWAENEFCKDNALKHISDFGYGKGYGILGQDFFIEISKLLNMPDKNVILIMHGTATTLKDRRGVEYTKYAPSSIIREKLITQIEGRVRFFLRAFADTTEDEAGHLITKRFLSLSPDGNTEYGIARGLTGDIPRNIPLDWNTFYAIATRQSENMRTTESSVNIIKTEKEEASAPVTQIRKPVIKRASASKATVTEDKPVDDSDIKAKLAAILGKTETVKSDEETVYEEPISETVPEPAPVKEASATPPTPATSVQEDKMAAIKAKLAAIKANKNN